MKQKREKLNRWFKSLVFPSGGMQGEGAKDLEWEVPNDVEILPCGCKRKKILMGLFGETRLVVRTTYDGNIICKTCGRRVGKN